MLSKLKMRVMVIPILIAFAVAMVFTLSQTSIIANAAVSPILELKFDTANAVKGQVPDSELTDFYLEKAAFGLAEGDMPGTVAFDSTEEASYGVTNGNESISCGLRYYIRAKDGVSPILGSDYKYVKVKFKSNTPLTADTTLSIRDMVSSWGYYAVMYNIPGTDWVEALFDLSILSPLPPVAVWADASLGGEGTFCIEVLDQSWANSYADPNFRIYLKSVTFYANATDALPATREIKFNTAANGPEARADYFVRGGNFGGQWTYGFGEVGFDDEINAVYVTPPEVTPDLIEQIETQVPEGRRVYDPSYLGLRIVTRGTAPGLSGKDYPYVKIKYMLKADLPAGTTFESYIKNAAHNRFNIEGNKKINEWVEVTLKLNTAGAWIAPEGPIVEGAWEASTLGPVEGVNELMLYAHVAGQDLANASARLYIDSMKFYMNEEDALADAPPEPTESEPAESTVDPNTNPDTGSTANKVVIYLCLMGLSVIIIAYGSYKSRLSNN